MKTTSRLLVGLFSFFLCAWAHAAGNLKVTLTPASAVSAGAQWRVDGGGWQNSGATKGLSAGTHTVDFKNVTGWLTPAATSVTITNGNTTSVTATYIQPAALTITLTPASAQWRIDGGAWLASGATTTGLAPGNHTIDYAAVSGYASPSTETVTLVSNQTTTLTRSYTQLAQLQVTLAPTTAQWRVDGGIWQANGTTVSNLLPGAHTVDYAALDGYSAPPSESVALSSGQLLTINRSYTQLAQLTITLSPTNGQWRLNGGAWQTSGTTLANLTPGNYTVEYATLSSPSWGTPPTETVALSAGQSLALTRNYTPLNQVLITLVPATGTWRLPGGAWQASGTTLWVQPGTYTLEYSPLEGYDPPASETFTSGIAATRYYTSTKPTLRIDLSPATGQWRLDGGAWQSSGTTLTELATGTHTLDYTDIGGDYAPLASESITLALRDHVTLQRTYPFKPATLSITLDPSYQQWRAVGATATAWQSSGGVVTIPPGNYRIEYSPLADYDAPATENLTLAPAQAVTLSRTYAPHPASLTLTLDPGTAEWRVYPFLGSPSGSWRASGATETGLAPGRYKIEFSAVVGYTPPDIRAVDLSPGASVTLSDTYTPIPPRLRVNAMVDSRYRVNGGVWTLVGGDYQLSTPGDYLVEFEPVRGYETPPAQTVTVAWGDVRQIDATYVLIPRATLTVNLDPSSGQFRLLGGPWQASGQFAANLVPDSYQVEFAPVAGYVTPPPQTVTLAPGENRQLTVTYTPLPRIRVNITPAHAQWRVDDGAWQASGALVSSLSVGAHTVTCSDIVGYLTPPTESLTLAGGDSVVLTKTYATGSGSLQVSLTPTTAHWRVDGGMWQASDATVACGSGAHVLEFEPLAGYAAPPSENLTLAVNETRALARIYTTTAPAFSVIKSLADHGTGVSVLRGSDGRLYCFATSGGVADRGQIFRLNTDGTGYLLLKAFGEQPGDMNAPSALIEASDGYLYGTSQYTSPTANTGTLFRLTKDGTGFTVLWTFTGAETAPNFLIEASDGALYGTTAKGGNGNAGVIFSVQKDGTNFRVVYSATGARGIVEGADGWLYATTAASSYGGTYGSIFKVTKQNFGFQIVRQLNTSTEGATPRAPLLRGSDGAFYCTTSAGGTANKGVVFRVNGDGSGFVVLRSFLGDATDGGRLDAPLVEGPDGLLYGATYFGGSANRGTVFRMAKDGSSYSVLRHFVATATDGGIFNQPLALGADGTLFGANTFGGGDGRGTLFRLAPDGTGFTPLLQLSAPDGARARGVIVASDGALYGVGNVGGGAGKGVVYKVNADGTGYTVLHRFAATNDGWQPNSPLLEASDGRLYGVTVNGNPTAGLLFSLNKDGSGYTRVHVFGAPGDAFAPYGSVIEASDGMLYGTTVAGGTDGYGTVYRVNKDGSGYAIVRSFTQASPEGNTPACRLLEGPDGMLYGTNSTGASGFGTIFRMSRDGSVLTVLHAFAGGPSDGAAPWAGVMLASNGRLYGTTNYGGQNAAGTLYSLALDGSGYALLKSFLGGTLEGAEPSYAAFVEKSGTLYGTTWRGGSFDGGTIYSLSLDGALFQTIVNLGLNAADARGPLDTLSRSPAGVIYGTTNLGGDGGTIFRLQTN